MVAPNPRRALSAVSSHVLFSLFRNTDMTPRINNAIEVLVDALRKEAPETTVTFNLFVNCQEWKVETSSATAAQLKENGMSMRNLRGDFIRENASVEARQNKAMTTQSNSEALPPTAGSPEIYLGGGYVAVPFDAVTLNGMFLPQLVTSRGAAVAVIGPDKRALQGESGGTHRYASLEEARSDVEVLRRINGEGNTSYKCTDQ